MKSQTRVIDNQLLHYKYILHYITVGYIAVPTSLDIGLEIKIVIMQPIERQNIDSCCQARIFEVIDITQIITVM